MAANVRILHALPDSLRLEAAQLYFEAFRQKLGPILGERGVELLADTFNADRVIVACVGQQLAGLAGVHYDDRAFVGVEFRDLRRAFGFWRALAKIVLLALLERPEKPDELLMDGIVVSADKRGQGIGSRLLEEVLALALQQNRDSVRLDVVDTNPRARALYERLGFVASETVQMPWLSKLMGFAASTTMIKRLRPTEE